MAIIIVFENFYFQNIIKKLTKCNTSNTFAFKNYGKFAGHNLEKLCLWSLAQRWKRVGSTGTDRPAGRITGQAEILRPAGQAS